MEIGRPLEVVHIEPVEVPGVERLHPDAPEEQPLPEPVAPEPELVPAA